MKHKRYKGKYIAKKRRVPIWFWLIPLILLLIGLVAMASILWDQYSDRAAFAQMAAAVQEAEETAGMTQAVSETTVPEATTRATDPSQTTESTQETVPQPSVPLPQYQTMFEENPEMVGWLRIEGTPIDYPVMHTPDDPEKYLHMNFRGEYSYAGVPFIDYRCTDDSDNLVIYGHNMSDGSMFRALPNYEREQYWKQHPVIRFDSVYAEREYEVVAAFYDRIYYTHEKTFKFYNFIDAVDQADYDASVAKLKEKSIYDTGVTPEYGDQLIMLVTCTYQVENGRFVLVAREKKAD